MSETNQAKADLPDAQEADVVDPLDHPANDNAPGLSELAEYEKDIYATLDTPAEEIEAEGTEEQGDQPADEPEVEEETEGADDSQDEEQEEQEQEQSNTSGRFRIRAKDDIEAEALSLRKRHPEWSLEKCLQSAKQILGVEEAAESEQQTQERAETESVASITEQIKSLMKEKAEAKTSSEFEREAEIEAQLEDLRETRENLRIVEARESAINEQREAQRFNDAYVESQRKTVTFYPDTTEEDSPIVKLMVQLDAQMQKLGDPIFNSPDKPFILAKMAAAELGIPMKQQTTAAKVKKSSPNSPIQPASGNARTSATAPATKLDQRLSQIETEEDYLAMVGGLTGS